MTQTPYAAKTTDTAQSPVVRLIVNGDARSFEGVGDVAGLVANLGLDSRKVAVELNLAIVPRSAYATTPVAEGDRIEIVHFIGGG